MFDRISRSWTLTKQSFAVLRNDKRLLMFPMLSGAALILVFLSFSVPLFATGSLANVDQQQMNLKYYALLFAFYFCNYFVIVFFNSALVFCANKCLSGGHATVSEGLSASWQRLPRILMWALVAASVGMVIRLIEDRSEKLGKIVAWLLGTAWTVMTYFIVPVLVFEDLGVIDAVKRSTAVLKKTWGEEVAGGFSMAIVWVVAVIVGIIAAFGAFLIHWALGVAFIVLYFLTLSVVGSAVKSIYITALYRYASAGEVSEGFTPEMMQSAFAGKREKSLAAGA